MVQHLRRAAALALVALPLLVPGGAHAAASANVQPITGDLFVGATDERNSIQVGIKPGEPMTLRVRDTFEAMSDPAPGSGCTTSGSPAELATYYLECPVTLLRVEIVLGGGDDNGEILAGDGPIEGVIHGGDGQDTLIGGDGVDQLLGGDGIDSLRGGAGDDFLYGEGTEDMLDGQQGSDLLVGGGGGDAFIDTGTTGTDTVTYFSAAIGVRVTVDDSTANDGENGGLEGDSVGPGFERIQGSAFDDVIVGGPAGETINGSKGNDDIDGRGGPDRIEGNEGDDVIRAQDGAKDTLLDCDSASSETQGTADVAIIDPSGIDPEPLRCENVQRGSGNGGATIVGLPAVTGIPTITGTAVAGSKLTCNHGTWTGSPSFAYGWFAAADSRPARALGTGREYALTAKEQAGLVYCVVVATNAAGSVAARTVMTRVPDTVLVPSVRNRPLGAARQLILKRTGGEVDFGDAADQKRDGRSIDAIPCKQGGMKGDCSRAKLRPGRAYATVPAAGKRIVVPGGPGAKIPRVRVLFYDAGKDEKLPPVKTRKEGDDCPLNKKFSGADRESFISSLIGKSEAEAGFFLAFRECRSSVRYQDIGGQEADPYVKSAQLTEIGGILKLVVARPKANDLAIVPFHRRLKGRDSFQGANLEKGPINPGIGLDGRLTTVRGSANDVCFAVVEASTGRLVPGTVVRARNPSGEPVVDRVSLAPEGGSTNADGVRCDSWRVDEEGSYRFTFVKYGENGVNEEGYLDIRAEKRRGTYVTLAGREIDCNAIDCAQTRLDATNGRAHAAQLEIAIAVVAATIGAIVRAIQGGRGVDAARAAATADALSGSQPEASLFAARRSSGVTPAVLTLGGTLAPSAAAAKLIGQDGAGIITDKGAGLTAMDGSSVVPAKGGSLVLAAGSLIGQDGAGIVSDNGGGAIFPGGGKLIGQDPAGVLSDNGLGLIGQDGAGIISGGAGNVIQIGGRAVLVDGANRLAPGTLVSGGAGNAIPVGSAG